MNETYYIQFDEFMNGLVKRAHLNNIKKFDGFIATVV